MNTEEIIKKLEETYDDPDAAAYAGNILIDAADKIKELNAKIGYLSILAGSMLQEFSPPFVELTEMSVDSFFSKYKIEMTYKPETLSCEIELKDYKNVG